DSIWFGKDESKKVIPAVSTLSGGKGKLSLAVESANAPFVFIKNNEIVGYEVDIAYRFCKEYGYGLELVDMNFDGIIPAVSSGKCSFGCSTITITEERRESVNFSEPHYDGGSVLAVRASDMAGTAALSAENAEPSYTEYNGKRIGIKTGSSFEPITLEKFPDSEYYYFDNESDLIQALQNNKIDGFLDDEPVAAMVHVEQPDVNYLKKNIMDDDYHFGFQKNTERSEKLRSEFNELVAELISNGELDNMKRKWLGNDESAKTFDNSELTGSNGEIMVVVTPDNIPFSYTANNQLTGYAVELSVMFARKYGYTIKFEQAPIAAGLAGLTSGKYDMIAGSLSYTEERAQSMDFSDVIYNGGVMLVVRSSDLEADGAAETVEEPEEKSFFGSIKESFNKNFIREDRYKLILQGISTTCIITVLSVVFGSVLAFLICLFRRADSVLSGKISDLYVKLLQGTPMVVLLMILYYVIFGKSGIAAMWVAVIGFSLNFAAYVSEILRSGIDSIDGGQREAALALGYSENQAFFRFIFPQAAVRQLPVYRGEIISLLKNTSIVGYIAIQDLTKMSDIIRSRTYEAFFPLIVTAVIYFILAWIISVILKFVLKNIDPKAKKKTSGRAAVKSS
ncbi:MAG: ABC transporter permease subunit, partial [Oscillospiraceae bacterium]|nr:ABC transporter permease subunit [Oscillospiraceae bacterium]